MNHAKKKVARLGGLLALVLGAAALLSLAGVAAAKDRNHDGNGDRGARDHGVNIGTVASFDAPSGKLTIALTGGDTLSGLVTAKTEIKCEGVEHHRGDRSLRSHDGSGSGEPGDDNGGRAAEPGDDNGGAASGVDNSGPGSASSGRGHDGQGGRGNHGNCTTAALVPGAVVQKAELRASEGAATFKEVELGHTN